MPAILKKIPAVTSFKRASVISDGGFYNLDESGRESPLDVIRHGIRGTQNINQDKDTKEVSNIQVTESARTAPDARMFSVRYGLKMLPLSQSLDACAGTDASLMREYVNKFIEAASESDGLDEVCRRIARNILNARWLWRNRMIGKSVSVSVRGENVEIENVDSLSISLNNFDDYIEDERILGGRIAAALRGSVENQWLRIEAVVDLGFTGSIEVFPSQNYIEKKPDGFARPLYKLGRPDPVTTDLMGRQSLIGFNDVRVMGQAALRDQKIGNALRTIDTWYPEAQANGYKPIPVEPEGANLDQMTFYRRNKKGSSAFDIARRLAEVDPNSEDGMFMIAAIMRGGVYGESGKE